MIDKDTRMLAHSQFITTSIVVNEKVCYIKPFFTQVNQDTGKIYKKYLRRTIQEGDYWVTEPVKRMAFGLPSKELREKYEKKKADFVDNLGQDILMKVQEIQQNEKVIEAYLGTGAMSQKQRPKP